MRPRRLFAANLVVFLIGIAMQVVVVLAAGETHAPENDSGMEL
jgi:hypothetical protein